MADVHDKQTRSYNMSQIKAKNTHPEMIVRRFIHAHGFRYSLHNKKLPGKPDIVLNKYKTIIDVRGCFWHQHNNCKYGDQIKTDSSIICSRRETALKRDILKFSKWKELGWRVIIIWADCELEPKKKNSQVRKNTLKNLIDKLKN